MEELEARLKESAATTDQGAEKGGKKSKSKKKKKKPSASQDECLAKPGGDGSTNADQSATDAKKLEVSSEADSTKKPKKSKKSKKKRKRGSVLLGQATEKVASEASKTVGDSESAAKETVSKGAEDGWQTAREVFKSSKDDVSHNKQSEKAESTSGSEGGGSRKRQRPAEEPLEESAAKVPRMVLPSDTDSSSRLDGKAGEQSAKDGKNSVKDRKHSTEDGKASNEDGQESAKNAGGSDKEGTSSAKELEPQKDISRKRKKDAADNSQDKDPKVRKQKADKQSGHPRRSLEQLDTNSASESRKRKRRSLEAHDDGSRKKTKRNSFGAREDAEAKVEEESGKKKRFRRKYLPEEPLKLRVMSK